MITAYLLSRSIDRHHWDTARDHFLKLSNRYKKESLTLQFSGFILCVTGDGLDNYITRTDSGYHITVANSPTCTWDRYLRLNFHNDELIVENDYAGAIPFFYSSRKGFVASNIEPCVYLATNASSEDMSPENIFGYIKYSHFIWDETAWRHIFQMLPDSRYHFGSAGTIISQRYLASVQASTDRVHMSDRAVAGSLYDLNKELVTQSLESYDEIILPLSSGYDSRMIFAVLADDKALAERVHCYTYGSEGSIDVEAGRRLALLKDVKWHHVELACNFLSLGSVRDIGDIFGASLHMHGMYQLEFFEQIRSRCGAPPRSALTSGFMTGVPAGQHIGLLATNDGRTRLSKAMSRFSQSQAWRDGEMARLPIFRNSNFEDLAETRFRAAYERFDGDTFQKAAMVDVWTRQRNFISYYPRTLEWVTPVISPHMNSEYANFFMSLSRPHLQNRRAVELMLLYHYADLAAVPSNSNGLAALGNRCETFMLWVSRVLAKLKVQNLLPRRYKNASFDFDTQAILNAGPESFWPLLSDQSCLGGFYEMFGGRSFFERCLQRAQRGDARAYAQIIPIQSLAYDLCLNAEGRCG